MTRPVKTILLLASLFLAACATSEMAVRIPDPGSPVDEDLVGRTVAVVLKDLSGHEFEVTEMTDEGLDGEFGLIAFEDMSELYVIDRYNSHTIKRDAKQAGKEVGAQLLIYLGIIVVIALAAG